MGLIDYILLGILGVAVVGIVVWLIKKKEKDGSGCGCGCSGCSYAGACHSEKTQNEDSENKNV